MKKNEPYIDFIKEPMVTENGFLNEAFVNAFDKAINSIPPDYERLANLDEWNTKKVLMRKDIIAGFAASAILQSPYSCPEGLENVCGYLDEELKRYFEWDKWEIAILSLCKISRAIHYILLDQNITQFDAWNEPKKDWRKSDYRSFQDAEDDDPDYGFIDLHALLRNTCLYVRDKWKLNDLFDEKCKK